jgi:hypothetical protein
VVAEAHEKLRVAASKYRAVAVVAGTWEKAVGAKLIAEQAAATAAAHVLTTILERAEELFDVSDGTVGPGDWNGPEKVDGVFV